MQLTPAQKQLRDQLLADMAVLKMKLTDLLTVEEPMPEVVEEKPWPQIGDMYLLLDSEGDVITKSAWFNDDSDRGRLAVGNVYRPERRAYAERHVEATKVQTELRRMPGICRPVKGSWFISYQDDADPLDWCAVELEERAYEHVALAGVHFISQKALVAAVMAVSPARLAIFRDDYLQVPIKGEPDA